MENNKLKILLIVVFSLIATLWSEIQGMQVDIQQEKDGHPKKRVRDNDEYNNLKGKKPKISSSELPILSPYFASGVKKRESYHADYSNLIMCRNKLMTRRESYQAKLSNSFAHRKIPNQLMFLTVYIKTNITSGTGFVFNFEPEGIQQDTYIPCLVTNKHVIINEKNEKANKANLVFHKKTNITPKQVTDYWFLKQMFPFNVGDIIKKCILFQHWSNSNNEPCLNGEFITAKCPNKFHEYWIMHPDPDVDLCILPLNFFKEDNQPFYIGIDREDIPSKDQIRDLSASEKILMVGYPNNLWDKENNFPIFRRGFTATHPEFDFDKTPPQRQLKLTHLSPIKLSHPFGLFFALIF